jgi:hypothetical protein
MGHPLAEKEEGLQVLPDHQDQESTRLSRQLHPLRNKINSLCPGPIMLRKGDAAGGLLQPSRCGLPDIMEKGRAFQQRKTVPGVKVLQYRPGGPSEIITGAGQYMFDMLRDKQGVPPYILMMIGILEAALRRDNLGKDHFKNPVNVQCGNGTAALRCPEYQEELGHNPFDRYLSKKDRRRIHRSQGGRFDHKSRISSKTECAKDPQRVILKGLRSGHPDDLLPQVSNSPERVDYHSEGTVLINSDGHGVDREITLPEVFINSITAKLGDIEIIGTVFPVHNPVAGLMRLLLHRNERGIMQRGQTLCQSLRAATGKIDINRNLVAHQIAHRPADEIQLWKSVHSAKPSMQLLVENLTRHHLSLYRKHHSKQLATANNDPLSTLSVQQMA